MRTIGASISLVVVAFIIFYNSHFTINDNQQVVITQFGKVVKAHTDPGEYYRLPFIQKANYVHKGPLLSEIHGTIATLDKKFIHLDAKVYYKISDPIIFLKTLNNQYLAKTRIEDIVDPAVRIVITSHRLNDLFSEKKFVQELVRKRCNTTIEDNIEKLSGPKLKEFGIKLIVVETLVTYPSKES